MSEVECLRVYHSSVTAVSGRGRIPVARIVKLEQCFRGKIGGIVSAWEEV